MISSSAARASVSSAGALPSQAKPLLEVSGVRCRRRCSCTSIGRNTRKPTAAASPTPSAIDNATSVPAMCGTGSTRPTIVAAAGAVEQPHARSGASILRGAMLAFVRELESPPGAVRAVLHRARAHRRGARAPAAPGLCGRARRARLSSFAGCRRCPRTPTACSSRTPRSLLPELTVITRPGAASRRAEVDSVAATLARAHAPRARARSGHARRRGRAAHRTAAVRGHLGAHQCGGRRAARRRARALRLRGTRGGPARLPAPEERRHLHPARHAARES